MRNWSLSSEAEISTKKLNNNFQENISTFKLFITLIHHFKRWINVNMRDEAHIYSLLLSLSYTKLKCVQFLKCPTDRVTMITGKKRFFVFRSLPFLCFWAARAIHAALVRFYMWCWTFIVFFKLCVYKHTNSKISSKHCCSFSCDIAWTKQRRCFIFLDGQIYLS
jgi:hypothetical protein